MAQDAQGSFAVTIHLSVPNMCGYCSFRTESHGEHGGDGGLMAGHSALDVLLNVKSSMILQFDIFLCVYIYVHI